MTRAISNGPRSRSVLADPWVQLVLGVLCMASVANMQYGWTLFVDPIDARFHWGRSAIQITFTIFVAIETWLMPVEGYLVDRFGPRWVVLVGGVLVAVAWSLNSAVSSLAGFYLAAAIGGIGTGCVYGTCVGNALKWFPGRRGLAAGITAAGFGAGAAATIVPISNMINTSGYDRAFLFFGLLQGGIVCAASWSLLAPSTQLMTATVKPNQTTHGYTPAEVLRNPCFYVLYVMFVLVAAGGLTMTASLAPIAKDLLLDKTPVTLLGVTMAALAFALFLGRILDGIGRPFFGWLSDQIGREPTMALAFLIGAGALYTLSHAASSPTLFVLMTTLYFGVYGEIFSLFPATQGDTFGAKYAAANAGMLYSAKGAGSLLVFIAADIARTRGWAPVFDIAMAFNVCAAALALFVLKPLRARHFAASCEAFPAAVPTIR